MAQTQMSANLKLINAVFAAMLVGMVGYFIYWGLGYTHYNHSILFIIATMFGVFMAFNVGGNDIANSFGTSVGSGTLTIPQALLIAAVFEVSGAVIAGGEVTDTIRKGIVDLNGIDLQPMQFVFIMMSALLAAALWLLFASRKGLPVSTTHAIIGGMHGGDEQHERGRSDSMEQIGRNRPVLGFVPHFGRYGFLFTVFQSEEKRFGLQRLGGRHAQGHQARKKGLQRTAPPVF